MKIKTLFITVCSLALISSSPVLLAKEPKGPKPPKEKYELKFDGKVKLEATTNAPAGAGGSAQLKLKEKGNHSKSEIKIKTNGLEPGDYVIGAVKKSDGSSVALSELTVRPDGKGDGREKDVQAVLDVNDIAQILISDLSGNVVLASDPSELPGNSKTDLKSEVEVEPGPAATHASGKASIRIKLHKDHVHEHFKLSVKGLSPNTTYNVLADGVKVGEVVSNHEGNASVRELPGVNLITLQSVQLTDAGGIVAASANF